MSQEPIKDVPIKADPTNATLVDRQDLTHDLALFRIRPDSGPVATFKPGQFATIGLPDKSDPVKAAEHFAKTGKVKLVRRAYSIASSPETREYIELYIVKVADGALTPSLFELRPGGRLFMDTSIRGEFTLDHIPAGKDLVMISTGTGLAPFMSMIRTAKARGQKRWNTCTVIHGARIVPDLGYFQELTQFTKDDPSIFYIPAVTREPATSSWTGLRTRVPPILENGSFEKVTGVKLAAENAIVMLCGNPDMITAVQQILEPRGFITATKKTPGNIHFERYW